MSARTNEDDLADLPRVLAGLPRRISDILRLGHIDPEAEALRHGARRWTFGALAAAGDAAAASLAAAGVRGGDRVLIVGENCPALLALLLGVSQLDAWPVIVNARLSPREIDSIAAHCEPRRRLFTTDVSSEAKVHADRHGADEPLALRGIGEVRIAPLDRDCRPEPVHADPAQQVAALIYTSGTTGDPKGVMLTHRNLLYIARMSSALRNLRPDDRVYAVLPLSHVYGLASVSLGALFSGACLELESRFTPQAMLAALTGDDGVSVLQGVPSMYAKLVDLIEARGGELSAPRLRVCFAGGAPLDASLKARVERVLGVTLHNGYGLTEAAPTIAMTRLGAARTDCSVGPALPGVELRIVDPHHSGRHEVADGESGELWVRGPNVMRGYYKNEELTARAINPGGWLDTGDLARRAPDGALFIVGRTKELIIRSGFNVYPPEVESVLNAHPAIMHSAVVGRAVPGNEEVIAFVELRPQVGATTAEIAAYLRPLLAPYKQPSEIRIVATLPVAANGKVLKHRLADLAQQPWASQ